MLLKNSSIIVLMRKLRQKVTPLQERERERGTNEARKKEGPS